MGPFLLNTLYVEVFLSVGTLPYHCIGVLEWEYKKHQNIHWQMILDSALLTSKDINRPRRKAPAIMLLNILVPSSCVRYSKTEISRPNDGMKQAVIVQLDFTVQYLLPCRRVPLQ